MNNLYKLGVVVGIIAVYGFGTLALGAFIAAISEADDIGVAFLIAWILGLVAFLMLAVFTLEKFGLWV